MEKTSGIFIAFSIFLIACIAVMGCSDNSGSSDSGKSSTVVTTQTTIGPVYSAGDIVRSSTGSTTNAWLILSYDSTTDKYTKAFVYRNSDGTWGYRLNSDTSTMSRKDLEKVYTVKITSTTVSAVPVKTPTTVPTTTIATTATTVTTTTTSAASPTFRSIDPDEGNAGSSISATITGSNFQTSGTVTVLLQHSGTNITATGVSVTSSSQIKCTIAIPSGTATGFWDVVIINPDGKSVKEANYFTIHGSDTTATSTTTTTTTSASCSGLSVTSVSPYTVVLSATEGWSGNLVFYGSHFASDDTIRISNGVTTVTGTSVYMPSDSTSIQAFFSIPSSATRGTWSVTVTSTGGCTSTATLLTVN